MFFKYLQNAPRGTFLIKTTYKQLKVTFNKIKIPKIQYVILIKTEMFHVEHL